MTPRHAKVSLRCWLFGHKEVFVHTGDKDYYLLATSSMEQPTHGIKMKKALGFMRCDRCGRERK